MSKDHVCNTCIVNDICIALEPMCCIGPCVVRNSQDLLHVYSVENVVQLYRYACVCVRGLCLQVSSITCIYTYTQKATPL